MIGDDIMFPLNGTKKMLRLLVSILFISMLLIQNSYAFMGNSIKFDSITIGKGSKLSSRPIIRIFQDNKGYLWFISSEGLSRFDGINQKVFEIKQKIPAKVDISSTDIDSAGIIWLGTWQGSIYRFDTLNETFTQIPLAETAGEAITSFFCSKSESVWFSTKKLLFQLDKKSAKVRVANIVDNNSLEKGAVDGVRRIVEDSEGTVFIGTDKGLLTYEPKDNFLTPYLNVLDSPNSVINALFPDNNGILWIGANDGFFKFTKKTEEFQKYSSIFSKQNSVSSNVISSITKDFDGNLILGTDGDGLNKFDVETENFEVHREDSSDPYSISSNSIKSLYTDKSGNIWVGLVGETAKISRWKNIFNHTKKLMERVSTLSSNKISAICEDSEGNLWLGTPVGLDKYEKTSGMYIHFKNDPNDSRSLSNNNITSILQDSDMNIWIGTKNGLNRYIKENESFQKIFANDQASGLTGNNITSLANSANGELYIGTNSGFNIYNNRANSIIRFAEKGFDSKAPSSTNVKRLFTDKSKNLWIATDSGLNMYDTSKNIFVKYRKESSNPNSISSEQVNAITQSEDGTIWVGTSNGILEKLDINSGKFTHYGSKDGIECDTIYGLLSYNDILWLSTNRGLFKFDIKNQKTKHFTRENGLQKNEFNDGAYFISKSGEMFFGGENGFNNFYSANIKEQLVTAPIVITAIKVGGVDVPVSKEIDVSYKQNTVSVEFANLDYTAPENTNYKYMLVGLDKDWLNNGNRNIATYNNLSPNNYVFKVVSSGLDGKFIETGVNLIIRVTPNPFKTWYAYLAYILLISALIFTYVRISMSLKEKEIKRQKILIENLKKVDRMKDELLANTSHEFRTPLNGIIGIADSLKDGIFGEVAPKVSNNLKLILVSAKRLLRLVNDILDLAKINKGEFSISMNIVNFRLVLDDCVDMLKLLAEKKGLQLIDKVSSDGCKIIGDSFRIQQVIFNILGNAIKFTDNGFVEIGATKDKDMYLIYIKDSGRGIPKERLNDIFSEFVQVDGSTTRDATGTGLGLAITKKLIQIMGGDITVESKVGEGSIFKFSLPLAEGIEGESFIMSTRVPETFRDYVTVDVDIKDVLLTDAEQSESSHGSVIMDNLASKILIVDDEMINRVDINNRLLAAGSFNILNAENGEEAVKIVSEEGDIDLVLMDVMMPKMSGIEACRIIRQQFSHYEVPILMLTAKDQIKDIIEAFSAGANDYITKPYDREVLKARAKNLLELKYAVKNALQKTKDLKSEKQKRELAEMLAIITTSISRTLDIDEVMKLFAKDLKSYFNLKQVCILLNDKEPGVFNANEEIDYVDLFTHYLVAKNNRYIKEFLNNALKSNLALYIKTAMEKNCQNSENWTDFPIVYHDKILGIVSVQTVDNIFIDQESSDIITAVINQTGTAIENAKLYTQVKLLATVDGLTGLFIRRHFFELAEGAFEIAQKSSKGIAVIMMDIDNFKKVNDTYGHSSGDTVLKRVANTVKVCTGVKEMVGRYGGEEFIVATTNIQNAEILAESIRAAVEADSIGVDGGVMLNPTISVGLSFSSNDETSLFDIIKRADEALYKAKKTGKNKVVVYENDKDTKPSTVS